MIIDSDAHIEHFGVKGMRWGVRRQQLRNANDTVSEAKRGVSVAKQHKKEAKKIRSESRKNLAKPILVGASVATAAVGAVAIATMLSRSGTTPVSKLPTHNFRAEGPGFRITAQDGHTFDLLAKLYAEQQTRGR